MNEIFYCPSLFNSEFYLLINPGQRLNILLTNYIFFSLILLFLTNTIIIPEILTILETNLRFNRACATSDTNDKEVLIRTL